MQKLFYLFILSILLFIIPVRSQINPENIDIVRDIWGVPHIFAPTDAEVAYGLAWASSEDDFETIQKLLLGIRGRLAEVEGKDGAILDMLAHIVGTKEIVEEKYDEAFSPEFKAYLEAFVAGLNRYAETHPKEILRKKLFPITPHDIIESYVLTLSFLTNVYVEIKQIFTGYISKYEEGLSYTGNIAQGSNAFAFNGNKTADGNTYLAVNSHQPLEGLFSWYEAHLVSEEGLNILGGTFPGGCSIFHGTNEYLGWAATLNHPDLVDVYKLEMHPTEKLKYKFDGKWETLEVRPKRVKVKLGFLRISIKKTFYWSKYGTTIKGDDGFYSIRFPANMDVRSSEQLYHLNKAKSFKEFKEILNQGRFPGTNNVYADREGNIFYISHGQFPYRNPKYDWLKVLPGNTSETLWEPKYHPVSELVQYENPDCGYLFNTNGTPFFATCPEENLDQDAFDTTFGYQDSSKVNNRTIRAHDLISQYGQITWEDFKTIKYDQQFNEQFYTYNLANMNVVKLLDPEKYTDLSEAIDVINDWNFKMDKNNKEAAILVFTFNNLAKILISRGSQFDTNFFTEEEYVEALRKAKKHMLKHFGTLRIPLQEVQRHVRGDKDLGIGGGPEVLAANITQPYKKGKLKTYVGESYLQLVKFSKDSVEIYTVNAFGASNKPDSPHYNDQMEMFVDQKTKPMTLNKEKIYKEAERVYHPE